MRRVAALLLMLGCSSPSPTRTAPGACEPGSPVVFENARLTVSPTAVQFDTVTIGSQSSPAKLIVSNLDCGTTAAVTHVIDGSDEFAIVGGTCGPPLAQFVSCEASVVFRPLRAGQRTGRFVVSAGPRTMFTVVLDGTGVAPDAAPPDAGVTDGGDGGVSDGAIDAASDGVLDTGSDGVLDAAHGELLVEPTTYDFPATSIGRTSASLATFNVISRFDQPVGPLSTSILGGPSAADFALNGDTCVGSMLPPKGTCTVSVRFKPQTLGAKLASLRVGFGNTIVSAQLSGTGIDGKLLVSPSTREFGMVPVGMKSDFAFTVVSYGLGGGLVFAVAGMNAAEFMVKPDPDCQLPVLPNDSCTVNVTFAPASAGPKSAILVATIASGGTVSVTLSGTGL